MLYDYGTWNWTNCWRATFIMLLLAFLFGAIMGMELLGKILGGIGGVMFVIMVVVRFEDVVKVMDETDKRR
jgi:putative Ca2+/H+ antiporter (TMEM165/GDT1 family)